MLDRAVALVDEPDDSNRWPLRSPAGINLVLVRAFAKARLGEHILLVYEPGGRSTEVAFLAFGCLPFRIRLAEGPIGLPATIVHRVNPLVGVHKARDLPGVPPLLPLEKCSLDKEESRAAIAQLLEFIRQVQDRRVLTDIVAEAFKIFADRPEGAELRAADVGPLADEVERLLRQRVRRESVRTPLDPELINLPRGSSRRSAVPEGNRSRTQRARPAPSLAPLPSGDLCLRHPTMPVTGRQLWFLHCVAAMSLEEIARLTGERGTDLSLTATACRFTQGEAAWGPHSSGATVNATAALLGSCPFGEHVPLRAVQRGIARTLSSRYPRLEVLDALPWP